MKVTLLTYTPQPEKIVAAAAKLCYSSASPSTLMDGLTQDKIDSFLSHLSTLHHFSPQEHISFTFGIEGISRACLAQLSRHRIGVAMSVQSQRYVRLDGDKHSTIVPDMIADDPDALTIFNESVATSNRLYDELCHVLETKHTQTLIESGMDFVAAHKKAAKMANEDARAVLPNACATNLVLTMNARELNHFFSMRCCNRAQSEIHQLADEMLKLVYPLAPHIFANAGPGCCSGSCPEGYMTCGMADSVRQKYKTLKEGAHPDTE